MGFDPVTGDLWDTENGPYYGDEINLVKPGFNSGWAKVQGIWPITNYKLMTINLQPGYHFPKEEIAVNDASLFDFNGNGNYCPPEFTWNKSVGPTALKFFINWANSIKMICLWALTVTELYIILS